MATIEPRNNGSYRIVVSAGYDLQGKKLRHYETVPAADLDGLTQRQREKELERRKVLFEQKVKSGQYLDGERITFADFTEKWLKEYAEKQLSPSTLKSYKAKINQRILPALGHIKLSKLQPHHIMEFNNNISEAGIRNDVYYIPKPALIHNLKDKSNTVMCDELGVSPKTFIRLRSGEKTQQSVAVKIAAYYNMDLEKLFTIDKKEVKLSSKSIKHHHDIISSILTSAVEWGVIPYNPAKRIKAPRVAKKEVQYFDDEQVAKLFMALENEELKYKAAIYLTIDLGLRVGELMGLEWQDIDFDNQTVYIKRQRQYVHGYGIITKTPKTDSGIRSVTASEMVLNLLEKYRVQQKADKLKMGNLWQDTDIVFIHEDGTPMHPHRPYQWFQSFLTRHNLKGITFHALRHTNASLLIAEGVDIVTLSGRLGHSDKNVTLNTYSHIIKSKERSVANKMDAFYGRMFNDTEIN